MMAQRAVDDFGGLLADFRENPSTAEKIKLLTALSYQQPGEIPGGLQQLAEILQVDPDKITYEFQLFLSENEAARAKQKPKGIESTKPVDSFESLSDSGNSRRLVNLYGDRLRFCHSLNHWFIWTGDRWLADKDGEIYQYARAAVRGIYKEAATIADKQGRRDHATFALRSESERALKAMTSLARSEPEIPIRRETLDAHPMKLNLINGVLDLTTGELLDHAPEFFFTKIIPFAYDPAETAPAWEKFLDEITGGDKALKNFLQQIVGYCLTGSAREQVFFIFWGDGRNGKSTFIKVLLELLGPWAAQTSAETFLFKKNSGGFSDLARLADKRLVCALETDEGSKLSESLVKSLSGNDRVAARHHYQEFFEFDPTFKIILTTNHKPRIRGNDLAIWRRIRLVPFTWTIPEKKVDPDIFEKLKTEMPGILTWAVQGGFEWQNRGKLEIPEIVKDAVEEYKQAEDQVARFIADCCETGNASDNEPSKILYQAYQEWANQNGEHFFSAMRFGLRLQELGHEKAHAMTGNFYRNIKLINSAHGD